MASKNGHQHIVLELLQAGADINMQTKVSSIIAHYSSYTLSSVDGSTSDIG